MTAFVDVRIDTRGSDCPAPLMEMIHAVQEAGIGQVVAVLSDDAMARTDIPLWTEKSGNELLGVERHGAFDEIIVRKLPQDLSHAEDVGR